MRKKILIVLLMGGLIAAFFYLGLDNYLSLAFLKESRERCVAFYAENMVLAIAVYMLAYMTVCALSLPGAAAMTLIGGAVFGFLVGVPVVSFASTAGASLAFLSSRYLLRDWIERRLGGRLAAINAGVEKEGAFYLFSLRLVPVFPFWAVNLLMGLTRMPLGTFFWVSQLGMLAGTMVYVNAGRELGKVESLSDVLSPGLVAAFVLLGAFPLGVRRALSFYRSRYSANRT